MWVQCILCDRYIEIDDETTVAKRIKKRPDFAFVCSRCGGALGGLEKNVLPPGRRPEEVLAGEREAEPSFASWSEPKSMRQRSPRRGDGASPGTSAGADRAQTARLALPQVPGAGERPRRERGRGADRRDTRPRQEGRGTGSGPKQPPGTGSSGGGGGGRRRRGRQEREGERPAGASGQAGPQPGPAQPSGTRPVAAPEPARLGGRTTEP